MKFKNSLMSIGTAALLIGCGSSSSSKTPLAPETPAEKKAKICLDTNQNAKCDTGETFEEVSIWDGNGNSKIGTSLKGDDPLAYEDDNGYVFTAPVGFSKIYPGTTMQHSERIYNRVIENKTKADAKVYILSRFGGKEPSAEQKKTMADNFKTNIKAHPNANRYAVIAAVMNKAMTDTSVLTGITVNDAEIILASVPSTADLNVTEAYDVNKTVIRAEQPSDEGWGHPHHLRISKISAKNGVLVGGTYRHNGLIVVDTKKKDGSYKFSNFATVTDAGDDLPSASTPTDITDANSGASEPNLTSVTLTSNGKSVYYNVPERGDSNKQVTGLFKASIGEDGSVETTSISIGSTGHKIISSTGARLNKKISNYALANDDSRVIIFDADGILGLYNADLTLIKASDAADVDNTTGLAVTSTTVYTATAGKTTITKRGADLIPSGSIEIGFAADEMIINPDGTKMFAFTHGHDHAGKTNLALIDLTTDTKIDAGEFIHKSDGAAISPDFKKAVIFGHEEDFTDIVDLTVAGFAVQKKIAKKARTAAFINNQSLAISNRDSIDVLNVALTTDNNTLGEEIVAAKASLTEKAINGGPLNLIIKDLALSSKYGGVTITWTNTLPSGVLNNTTGAITRPDVGQSDVTGGTLNAALKSSFRDITINEAVVFTDLNVRVASKVVAPDQISSVLTGRTTYFAANADGSVAVAPARDTSDVYSMASYKVDAAGKIMIATAPTRFDAHDEIIGSGVVGNFAIFVAENEDAAKRKIYSVAINADGTLASTITSEVAIASGEPRKIEWTTDNTKAVVEVRKSNEDEVAEIYSVNSTTGAITLDDTYDMGAGNTYADHGPMAVNDDATVVYQKSSDRKFVRAITSSGVTETDKSFSRIARVWFAHGFLFVHDYEGNIHTLNATTLEKVHEYNTGTGGRMYGGEGRTIGSKNYYIIPVQQSSDTTNGIYLHEVDATGKLTEVSFANVPRGADRMAVSADGKKVFYGFSNEAGERLVGVVNLKTSDL